MSPKRKVKSKGRAEVKAPGPPEDAPVLVVYDNARNDDNDNDNDDTTSPTNRKMRQEQARWGFKGRGQE